ncbi:acyl carrier protein [Streptomyces sp. NPDC005538]|uniref:acyl carrier protein n=1 Tax=unclassified Streptomyces TaxID=2593676 RepID=UPI0033A9B4A5
MTTTQHRRDDVGAIQTWITEQVARYVNRAPGAIDPDESFSVYGLDSLYAVALCGDIEDHFELSVPATLVWDHDSVTRLADAVDSRLREARP